jgi:hypothetical protein
LQRYFSAEHNGTYNFLILANIFWGLSSNL